MSEQTHSAQVAALEARVAQLTSKLAEAKQAVKSWTDANASLSQSAAEARAKNQGAGRGFLGGLLGSKFRGAMRASAAASNAAIAKEVADKRGRISEGKRQAQELVRAVQEELAFAKAELKAHTAGTKTRATAKTAVVKSAGASLDLLKKLKDARDAGLLTEEEFEEKRKKLVSEL
jgi:cell division septum initiation protein DivIVA